MDITYLNGTDQRQIASWGLRAVEAFKAKMYVDQTSPTAPNRAIAEALAGGLSEAMVNLERALHGRLREEIEIA